jgi:predicted nuclease of predicted toxin-antitoxin system
MKFKIDENLPIEIAEMLRNAGHDAKTVNEQLLQGIKDNNLIDICLSESRILVSLDMDFSNITEYPPHKFNGIIVMRIINQSKKHIITVFKRIIPLIKIESLKQKLWIVDDTKIRIRDDLEGSESKTIVKDNE